MSTSQPAVQSETHAEPIDQSRLPELDGIRGIAIWMVMLFHAAVGWPIPSGAIPGLIKVALYHGWLGVDLFFILSGFLITGILLKAKDRPKYFRNFYGRRVLRIMPLYFAFVIICFIFYRGYRPFFIFSTLFAANLAPMFGISTPHGPWGLWSLAVEEHFYLLWPFLVLLLSRRNLAVLGITIVVLTPVARWIALAHGIPFNAPLFTFSWFRFDGLALGALLAIWVRSPLASSKNSYRLAAGLISVSALITIIGIPLGLVYKGGMGDALVITQTLFVFAGGVLTALVLQSTPFTMFLRRPFARLSGSLSYCLYLVHVPLGDVYHAVVESCNVHPEAHLGGLGSAILRGVTMIVLSFMVALLSRRYFEEPFLRLKKHF